jgi:transglutaminase-like putative cysteine protease
MGVGMAGTAEHNVWYLPMLGVFLAMVMLDLRLRVVGRAGEGRRRVGWVRYGVAVGLVVVMAVGVDTVGLRQAERMNRWLVQRMIQAGYARNTGGFDRNANLNSIARFWENGADEQVVLRVFAERAPEPYLRGAAFDRYNGGVWELIEEQTQLAATGTDFGRQVYNASSRTSERRVGVVHAQPGFVDAFFVPGSAHQIGTFSKRVKSGTAGTLRPLDRGAAGGYAWYEPGSPQMPPGVGEWEVAGYLRATLEPLARRIMGEVGDGDAAMKIRRVTEYFRTNYTYALGVAFDHGGDPVVSFLEGREGHCEYFAAATTLLLRCQGIAARYVTGFVCEEPGLGGDYWVARRRNAHAWVEAWVDGKWVTVEATPANARPAAVEVSGLERMKEWMEAQWRRTVGMMFNGGLGAAVDWLVGLPARVPMWLWIAASGAGVVWVFRREIRGLVDPRQRLSRDPAVRSLQRKLAMAERMLGRHGVVRGPGMTVGRLIVELERTERLPQPVRLSALGLLREYQRERFRGPGGSAESGGADGQRI